MGGEVGETGRSWERGNHNQNILYEKKNYFQLKKENLAVRHDTSVSVRCPKWAHSWNTL